MQHLVVFITDDYLHDGTDRRITTLGFSRQLSTKDELLSFQLPNQTFVATRDGVSAKKVRDDVLAEIANAGISGFVLVAEAYLTGRT